METQNTKHQYNLTRQLCPKFYFYKVKLSQVFLETVREALLLYIIIVGVVLECIKVKGVSNVLGPSCM